MIERRDELLCVISDLTDQCNEKDAEIKRLNALLRKAEATARYAENGYYGLLGSYQRQQKALMNLTARNTALLEAVAGLSSQLRADAEKHRAMAKTHTDFAAQAADCASAKTCTGIAALLDGILKGAGE